MPGKNRVTQAAIRVLVGSPLGKNRVTQAAIRVLQLALPPDAPTISVTGGHGLLRIETDPFSSDLPNDEHLGTVYEVTTLDDPDFENPVESFELTFGSGLLTVDVDTLDGEVAYLSRAAHRGKDGLSDWSPVVEETTLEVVPKPDAPTISLEDLGPDFFRVRSTVFSHPEGSTTIDEYDPEENALPYLVSMRYQAQVAGGAWGEEDLLFDTAEDQGNTRDLELFMDERDPETVYEVRGLHVDGHYGLSSPWSDVLQVETPPIPPVQPGKPVVTITSCGPGQHDGMTAEIAGFEPPAEDPGAEHQRTQWKICSVNSEGGEKCKSRFSTTPGELLEIHWETVPPGTYRVYARVEDDEDRLGPWSDPDECEIGPTPAQPVFTEPVSGLSISQVTKLAWEMLDDAEGEWEFRLRVAGEDGVWETLLDWSTADELLFTIGGRADGAQTFRLEARDTEWDIPSESAFLLLHLDRTQRSAYSKRFADDEELPGLKRWSTSDVSWEVVDSCLRTSDDAGYEGAFGIRAVTTKAFQTRRSNLVFPEIGKPDEGEFVAELAIVGKENHWYFWKWAHTHLLRGGLAYRITGGADTGDPSSGYQFTMNSGVAPFGIWPGRVSCSGLASNTPCPDNPCAGMNCGQCSEGAAATAWAANDSSLKNNVVQYGRSYGKANVRTYGRRPAASVFYVYRTAGIDAEGPKTGGAIVSQALPGGGPQCCWMHWFYQLRVKVTRSSDTHVLVQVKVLGPGFDPDVEWHQEESVKVAELGLNQADEVPCGYCGLALEHLQSNLGHQHGILFRSFSASNLVYNVCEEPEEPPVKPPGAEQDPVGGVDAPCVVTRRLFLGLAGDDDLRQYQDIQTDDDEPVEGWARTREIAPFGLQTEAAFRDVYFSLSAWTTGILTLTPVVDGKRKESAQRTIEFTSDGTTEETKRYELALYERILEDDEEVGRRGLRGTFFRLEVEVVDLLGSGRVNVGGFELQAEPVSSTHPDQVYTDENAVRRHLVGTPRKFFLGLSSSDDLLEYGSSSLDDGEAVPLYARSRPAAPAGAAGEVTFLQVSIPMYRANTEDVVLHVTPVVDGEEFPELELELAGTAEPVREVRHLDIYRPIMDGEVEVGRNAIRGTWWVMEIRGPLGVPDGTIRIGQTELEIEQVIETQEPE